jgi:hypothetical protein
MPPLTRARSREIFQSLVSDVLDSKKKNHMPDALERADVEELEGLTSIAMATIESLEYEVKDKGKKSLHPFHQSSKYCILHLCNRIKKLQREKLPHDLTDDDWDSLTLDNFNTYLLSLDIRGKDPFASSPITTATANTATTATTATIVPASNNSMQQQINAF